MEGDFAGQPTGSCEAEQHDRESITEALHRLHICRGTTGDTIREALPVIDKRIGVQRHDIPERDVASHPGAAWGTLGQCVVPGLSEREILLAAPTSEPSTNDHDLSGLALLTVLCEWLASAQPRFTYRAIFAPAALSVRSSLRLLEVEPARVEGGLAFYQLGGSGSLAFRKSHSQSGLVDRVVARTVAQDAEVVVAGGDDAHGDFPGPEARVGSLRRSLREGTSRRPPSNAKSSGSEAGLENAFSLCKEIIANLECSTRAWINLYPYGEPCLGKRGLYNVADPREGPGAFHMAMLWVLNQSDGRRSLLDIAERSERPLPLLARAADQLEQAGLLEPTALDEAIPTGTQGRAAG